MRRLFLATICLLPAAAFAQAVVGPVPMSQKGAPGGVPSLDGNAKLPIGQIPVGLTSTTVPSGDLLAAESSQARTNEAAITATQFVAATGTNQSGAASVTALTVFVTGGAVNSGIVLSQTLKNTNVRNTGSAAILVYPATGGTINGGATNAAVSIPAGGSARFGSADGVTWSAG